MTALSYSSGTSSGWLEAIPSITLGLAIPGPEFVVGLHIWLGVSLFPPSPLCTCLSNFGDHLLGCSQGPMRICRHALVNVVYNALAQDHPGVLKEQGASCDDGLRPGDVFHPHYQHGCLTSTFLFAVPLSHLLFPPLLHDHVLVWLLLERLPRTRNILQLWRSWGQILFL